MGDDPEMEELVEYFIGELPRHMDAIRDALEARDRHCIRRISHQLKGAAGGYGFPAIGEAAAALEVASMSAEADVDQVRERVEDLLLLCRRARP